MRGAALLCAFAVAFVHSAADQVSATPRYRRQIDHNVTAFPAIKEIDIYLSRTLVSIKRKTEYGRMVLLLCKRTCSQHKNRVPQWINAFSREQGYPMHEVGYNYYLLKNDLPFLNGTDREALQTPTLVYLIGNEAIFFSKTNAVQTSQGEEVLDWLRRLDVPQVIEPRTFDQLDAILDHHNCAHRCPSGVCSDKYIVYSPRPECEIDHWRTISRLLQYELRIKTIYIRNPMENTMATDFFMRLNATTDIECRVFSYLHLNHHTMSLSETTPAEVLSKILSITSADECGFINYQTSHFPVQPALSDLQMQYYSQDRLLVAFERGTAYVVVGATAGIAVVALAISIFWGLNGSSFASR